MTAPTPPTGRSCYCEPGQTSCGTCSTCGAPGHTRHHPGAVPYTGAWCDGCWDELVSERPRVHPGQVVLWVLILLPVGYAIWRIVRALRT